MSSWGCHVNGAKVEKLDPRTVCNFFFGLSTYHFECVSMLCALRVVRRMDSHNLDTSKHGIGSPHPQVHSRIRRDYNLRE